MLRSFVLVSLVLFTPLVHGQSVTVVSYGGSFALATEKAIHNRFEVESGIDVDLDHFNGGLAQVRSQVEIGKVYWDVVDFEMAELVRACDEGLIVPIETENFSPGSDGTPAHQDFDSGTITECGVGKLYFSTVYAYNEKNIGDIKPATINDFFDMAVFPGRRGLRRVPQGNLEFALMADGVRVEEVYAVLDKEAGVDRAFEKLDTIKENVVWWETGAQPPQLLADGEVVMTTAYNGRIFNAQALEGQPFVIVWDGQILKMGAYGIVEGTQNLVAARRFVDFATSARSMAELTRYIAYSPTRQSAMQLIGVHAETGVEMMPHLPTGQKNMARALHNNWQWWSDNGEEINDRFSTWLTK